MTKLVGQFARQVNSEIVDCGFRIADLKTSCSLNPQSEIRSPQSKGSHVSLVPGAGAETSTPSTRPMRAATMAMMRLATSPPALIAIN